MMALLLRALIAIAGAGTLASLVALLLAGIGLGALPFWYATAGVAALVVSLVGMFAIQTTLQLKRGAREMGKLLRDGCPKPVRWPLYLLSLVGVSLWFALGFRNYQPPSGGMSSLMASAFGLGFFPITFVSFYSYYRMRPELLRRCPNGHPFPLGGKFCSECGEQVRPVA